MESRYDPEAAQRMIDELTPRVTQPLALRTYSARLIGAEPSLVLHGGGNTSVKAQASTALGD
jgi:rhamnose utilization protein RhaD (predicted bifunctional aldolase and dehydrogenase)